ncbi:MAG: hypothetical protein WB239_10865 [Acidimicrobiia bacterium]
MGRNRSRTEVNAQRALTRLILAFALVMVAACSTPTSGTTKGIVVDVQGSLTNITQFTVLVEGDDVTFHPSPDGDYDFPLAHLREHMRTGQPVLVGWEREDDGQMVALSLSDG